MITHTVRHIAGVATAAMLLAGCLASEGNAEPPAATAQCALQTSTVIDYPTPGGERQYRLIVPAGASATTPLIVGLHGATGSMEQMQQTAAFDQAAIQLFPQSRGTPPNTVWDASPASSDITFVADLISDLHREHCSSPASTVVTGFSMGAMVTSRLACAYPQLMTGIGLVAGVLPPVPGCRIPKTMRVVIIHARDDDVVPFAGRLSPQLRQLAGGPTANRPGTTRVQMAKLWARAKRCVPLRTRRATAPAGIAKIVRFSCRKTQPTIAVVYKAPAGHTWLPPNGPAGGTTALLQKTLMPLTEASERVKPRPTTSTTPTKKGKTK